MGLFTALFLAEHVERVTVLERRVVGAGSSGKSGAVLRQHYSNPTTIRMARESLAYYRTFHERTGHDIGFETPGMLFVGRAGDREQLETHVERQRTLGVDVSVLDGADLRGLEPRAVFSDDEVAAHERVVAIDADHLDGTALQTLFRVDDQQAAVRAKGRARPCPVSYEVKSSLEFMVAPRTPAFSSSGISSRTVGRMLFHTSSLLSFRN